MSWESTAVYYRRLNQLVADAIGGTASAQIILHSFDFAAIDHLQHEDRWDELADVLSEAACGLRDAGADLLLIATNTMHLLANDIENRAGIPVVHIADATASAVKAAGYRTVLLLGTRFTMEKAFYRDRIENRGGAQVLIPRPSDRETVHRIIYSELVRGLFSDLARESMAKVIQRGQTDGAEAVILGCTELPLLITPESSPLPILDTTEIHVQAAVAEALRGVSDYRQ